jgi:hypothetical protein
MAGLSNYFDECKLEEVDGITDKIFTCKNFMGQIDRHVLYSDKYAICEYHYCVIQKNRQYGSHTTLSCSGAMMRFGSDNQFFNPITPFEVKFSEMVRMPISSVELMGVELEYYYSKDVRTIFSEDIIDLNCTNDFKTCLTFNNATTCFGNINNQEIIHSEQALVWGSMTSLVLGSFVVFVLMPKLRHRGLFYMLAMYLIPLIGIVLIYSGIILGAKIPFIMSGVFVFLLFPIIYYTLRDVHKDSKNYKKLSQKEELDDGNIRNVF